MIVSCCFCIIVCLLLRCSLFEFWGLCLCLSMFCDRLLRFVFVLVCCCLLFVWFIVFVYCNIACLRVVCLSVFVGVCVLVVVLCCVVCVVCCLCCCVASCLF